MEWPIYPMYDWAHGLSDSIEGVTHSLCSLEFENHRPLYDWCLEKLEVFRATFGQRIKSMDVSTWKPEEPAE